MAFSVSYVYNIVDRYSGKLAKIRKQTDRYKKSAGKARLAAKKFSTQMLSSQSSIASIAGVIGGAAVLGVFTDFETSMNKLNAVTLGTDKQMARMRATAKQLGATTQFSAGQAAKGMTFLAMAGLDTDQVLAAIPGTLQLAAAGGIDLASAADIATNVLAQMGLEVKDLTRVNDVLSLVQARANTNILEAAEAMKNVGATASSLNVSMSETASLIGAMANAGTKGGEAGTLLRNAMLRLVNPSKKAQKIFKKLGIDLRDFVTPEGKIKNFTKLVELLGKKNATTADLFKMFEERGGRAILNLQKIGTPAIEKLTAELSKAGGTAEKMAKIQMRGLPGVLKELKSVLEAVTIAIFESGLDKFLIGVFQKLTLVIRSISQAHPAILKMVAGIGLIVVVLGPVLMMLGLAAASISALIPVATVLVPILSAIAVAIGAISAPILITIGVIALLVAGFILIRKNWMQVVDVIGGTINEMVLMFERGLGKITGFFGAVKGFFGGDGLIDNRVTANGAGMDGTLNGKIDVTASGGAKVNRAEMNSSFGGNLGLNMAGG